MENNYSWAFFEVTKNKKTKEFSIFEVVYLEQPFDEIFKKYVTKNGRSTLEGEIPSRIHSSIRLGFVKRFFDRKRTCWEFVQR